MSSAERRGVGEVTVPGRETKRRINLNISSTKVSLEAASRPRMCVSVYSNGLRLVADRYRASTDFLRRRELAW